MDYDSSLDELIKNALQEDIGDGDHSTLCCIEPAAKGTAILKVKETGLLAGMEAAKKIFSALEPSMVFIAYKKDGDVIMPGDIAFNIQGNVHTILSRERLVLNIMQRMSGIATLTNKYVKRVRKYKAKILDTRKTTPNFRLLEKEAVRIGGGTNHRFGLFDMILLKDNHIDYCGGVEKAIEKANGYLSRTKKILRIEVETRSIDDVKKVLETGNIDRIMLDNFSPAQVAEAVRMINGKFETEASGGITFENVESYAAAGVDYISCGAIIHHATSLDLSLKAQLT